MYGIFTYIYHKNHPNVGKYTIHGWYGYCKSTTIEINVGFNRSKSCDSCVIQGPWKESTFKKFHLDSGFFRKKQGTNVPPCITLLSLSLEKKYWNHTIIQSALVFKFYSWSPIMVRKWDQFPCKKWRCFTDFCRKEGYEVEPRSLVYKDSHHPTSIIIHLQETVVNMSFVMILYQASTKHFRKQPNRNHLMRTADPLRIPSFVLKRVNGMVCTQAINLNIRPLAICHNCFRGMVK